MVVENLEHNILHGGFLSFCCPALKLLHILVFIFQPYTPATLMQILLFPGSLSPKA